jgi:YYY domain-containing protein
MLELFQIWGLVEILGLICLPLTFSVFRNLPDRGWAFSKALGMVLLAFCVWLPLMCVPVLPFNQLFIAGVTLLLLAGSSLRFMYVRRAVIKMVHQNVLYILVVESLFLAMVFLLGWVRSFGPDIRSYEMFMDEGFIATIMRSPHLPPNDMWFAGYRINYYYFAHYTIAVLAKLLGQPPSIAFNTGICICFGLCAVNLFGITCNIVTWARYVRLRVKPYSNTLLEHPDRILRPLWPAIPYGLLSMLMALIFGNLASAQQWWTAHDSSSPNLYDLWFNPSRVIPNTINEFPAFSFLISCFHAHVLSLAFTIMAMGLAFNLLLEAEGRGIFIFGRGWSIPLNLSCTALVLGCLFTMNGWDYPTYMGLTLVCIIGQQWFAYHEEFSLSLLFGILVAGAGLIALSLLFYLPFYLTFVSPAQGIGLISEQSRSMLSDELLVFGLFAFIFFSLLLMSTIKQPLFVRSQEDASVTPPAFTGHFMLLAYLIPWIFSLLILVLVPNSATFVIGSNFAILGAALMCYHCRDRSHAFVLLLGATAFTLVAGCEVFFLKDAFAATALNRMNTVFKFYFQAWVLLSVTCSAGLFLILDSFRSVSKNSPFLFQIVRGVRLCWSLILLGLVLASMVYPLTAPYERYASDDGTFAPTYLESTNSLDWLGSLANLEHTNSLDGLEYLKNCQPANCPYANSADDYVAIRWLNANIQGDPVIVEAMGDDYSFYGRISVFTGLPTLMGWAGHEQQWRLTWLENNANNAEYLRRGPDIDKIYTSPDPHVVLSLMARYKAQYLYIGPLEIEKYTNVNLHRYNAFMQVLYKSKGVTIYKVR